MSLTAFDASALHGFVGSPLYGRNRQALNTDAIGRVFGNLFPAVGLGRSVVFPIPYPIDGHTTQVTLYPLGNQVAFKAFAVGWNRLTLLVWGVSHVCNPWTTPPSFTSQTIPPLGPPVPFTVYDDNPEFSFYTSAPLVTQEDIPDNRSQLVALTPNRIPLNCILQEDSDDYVKSNFVFQIDRTVAFSAFSNSSGEFQWVFSAGGSRPFNIALHDDGRPAGDDIKGDIKPANLSLLNPNNPITLNNQVLPVFHERNPLRGGICYVLQSIAPDTQYRPIVYTDTIFSEDH